MADKYFLYIIAEMDRLWFHQVILFSEPTPPVAPKLVEEPLPLSESLSSFSSSILSLPPLPDEETSTDESTQVSSDSISVPLQDGSFDNKEETKGRMNLLINRTHSHSSSPSSHQNHHRKLKKQQASSKRKLQKTMSCRTLGELELDEVKGFMDLGFIFKRENLSPRMISVVPGLQRLGLYHNKQNAKLIIDENETERVRGNDVEAEEEKRDIMRPYLSEAWLIKRPDSPLLSLKIPKPCSASNMKKHLRFWAKTVALEISQE